MNPALSTPKPHPPPPTPSTLHTSPPPAPIRLQVTIDTEFYASPERALAAMEAVGARHTGRGGPPVRC